MSKFHSYIASATKLVESYSPGKPLSLQLKAFFSAHKKMGSKDRRMISSLCYVYYRVSLAFKVKDVGEKMIAGLFLCETKPNELLNFFRPDLEQQDSLQQEEKMALLGITPRDLFPFMDELGEGVEKETFAASFIMQPGLFLRIRPGKEQKVTGKLEDANIPFKLTGKSAIALSNNVPVEKLMHLNKDVTIQDLASQHVLDYLDKCPEFTGVKDSINAWDCCAGSGGKSILLYDKMKGRVRLTVSDIRENILANLYSRLQEASVPVYFSFIADLAGSLKLKTAARYNLVICDVPCTGSGTWSRTPEQLCFFDAGTIHAFAERQKKIAITVMDTVKPGGLFFYITCSVFKKENEDVVAYLQERFPGFSLQESRYIPGYRDHADTMFVAVLKNAAAE